MTPETGLVIVGGGPAGLAAARQFREHDSQTPVIMISADQHPPYARPPLTKDYLRGESGPDDLPLVEPSWYAEHGVELRLALGVDALDASNRTVRLADGSTLGYRDLVLATGCRPTPLHIPGGDDEQLVYVRDRSSGERLRALAERGRGRIAVIGSGFIGCEAAASLAGRGLEVIMVSTDDAPHATRLGAEAAAEICSWLTTDGVTVHSGISVAAVEHAGAAWTIALDDGRQLRVKAVVCGGGAQPNLGLAERAGLKVEAGGVVTDAQLRTSDPHIFAVGDIAYALNEAAGRRLRVEHWGEAENHGLIAGTAAAGNDASWATAPGFWSEIGGRTLKYTAWGDGFDTSTISGSPTSWAVQYRVGDRLVGVLSYNDDSSYEQGRTQLDSAIDPEGQ